MKQFIVSRCKIFFGFMLALAIAPMSMAGYVHQSYRSVDGLLASFLPAAAASESYGEAAAKFEAERAYMAGRQETASADTSSLLRKSHGFTQLTAGAEVTGSDLSESMLPV